MEGRDRRSPAEPLLANPVSFASKGKGRISVRRTFDAPPGSRYTRPALAGRGRNWRPATVGRDGIGHLQGSTRTTNEAGQKGSKDRVRVIFSSKSNGVLRPGRIFAQTASRTRPTDFGSGVPRPRKQGYGKHNIPTSGSSKERRAKGGARPRPRSRSTGKGYGASTVPFIGHGTSTACAWGPGRASSTQHRRPWGAATIEKDGTVIVSTPELPAPLLAAIPTGGQKSDLHTSACAKPAGAGLRRGPRQPLHRRQQRRRRRTRPAGSTRRRWRTPDGRIGYQYQRTLGP